MRRNFNELEVEYERWRDEVRRGKDERHGIVFGFSHDKKGFEVWVQKLSEEFQTMTGDERRRLRDIVSDADVLWLLNGYPLVASVGLQGRKDAHVAKSALSILMLVDRRLDEHEMDQTMRKLMNSIKRAGIEPESLLRVGQELAVSESARLWITAWSDAMRQSTGERDSQ